MALWALYEETRFERCASASASTVPERTMPYNDGASGTPEKLKLLIVYTLLHNHTLRHSGVPTEPYSDAQGETPSLHFLIDLIFCALSVPNRMRSLVRFIDAQLYIQ